MSVCVCVCARTRENVSIYVCRYVRIFVHDSASFIKKSEKKCAENCIRYDGKRDYKSNTKGSYNIIVRLNSCSYNYIGVRVRGSERGS